MSNGKNSPKIIYLFGIVDVEAGEYSVIFGPEITGGQMLLLLDQAWLQTNAAALWFKDEDSGAASQSGLDDQGVFG